MTVREALVQLREEQRPTEGRFCCIMEALYEERVVLTGQYCDSCEGDGRLDMNSRRGEERLCPVCLGTGYELEHFKPLGVAAGAAEGGETDVLTARVRFSGGAYLRRYFKRLGYALIGRGYDAEVEFARELVRRLV